MKIWVKCLIAFISLVLIGIIAAFYVWRTVFDAQITTKDGKDLIVYIETDDNLNDFIAKLESNGVTFNSNVFLYTCKALEVESTTKLPSGCYSISSNMTYLQLIRRVKNAEQTAVKLTINSVRLPEQFAAKVADQLMLDSVEIMDFVTNEEKMAELGYTPEHLFALLVCNTYEVWWNVSVDKLMYRLKTEHDAFWNANERRNKAEKLGLTIPEVITLASIVEEETNYQPEKSRVAGLYLNRLRKGILLQSDPTVKYALKDFTLNRILYKHLEVDNPYNTYKYAGLPPGPIRLPSIATIDAVLDAESHNYIFMCAHPDFNGTHNFAVTLAEHNRNASKYHAALNKLQAQKKNK